MSMLFLVMFFVLPLSLVLLACAFHWHRRLLMARRDPCKVVPFRRVSPSVFVIGAASALSLPACSQSQVTSALATPAGQLFCAVETTEGPQIVALSSAGGGAAVLATGATQAVVNADCAAATASIATATGPATPISPPPASTPVQTVAITPAS